MPVKFAAKTSPGAVRTNNEDSYSADPDLGLFMVADGMGGHKAGEVASAIAIFQAHNYVANKTPLAEALRKTHRDILNAGETKNNGMGSTGVAVLQNGQDYEVNWVGDSRAYRYSFANKQGHLERLTKDHSFVQTLIDNGSISEQEARNHPQRNVITQCLGNKMQNDVKVGETKGAWKANEWLILCSDGLTGELTDEQMSNILKDSQSTDDAVDNLVQKAMEYGGSDNITVVVVESPLAGKSQPTIINRIKGFFSSPSTS